MATLSVEKIKPGTTPMLTIIVDGEDITEATVYVTIDMKDRHITKDTRNSEGEIVLEALYEDEELIGTQITVQFSQADTLFLRPGYASLEVGWVFDDGAADKSDLARIKVPKTLYRGAMIYG